MVQDTLTPTSGTLHHRGNRVPTIVTFQFLRAFVVGQANITARTSFHMATGLTLLVGAESTSVLEEDNALPLVQDATHRIYQFHAKVPDNLFALLRAKHVHHL